VIVNTAITTVTNSSTGGAIASYAISPAAPAGLTFNTSTGQLSGTPTSTQSATAYTITATNAAGSATATFTLTVSSAAPAFSLSSVAETRVATTAITGYTITSTGAPITSYSLVGTLDTGLAFSTSTGRITGTPTETRTATTYTIIGASASGETATATYRLRVTGDIGDTGPGGGKIFYYFANGFACGPNFTDTGSPTGGKCRWLEVAPVSWWGGVTETTTAWANVTTPIAGINNEVDVGIGRSQTRQIIASPAYTFTAAQLASTYSPNIDGQVINDWYLGSQREMVLLVTSTNAASVIDTSTAYWTSTQVSASQSARYAIGTVSPYWSGATKDSFFLRVRPIRAF
jgi:hypothetical protein